MLFYVSLTDIFTSRGKDRKIQHRYDSAGNSVSMNASSTGVSPFYLFFLTDIFTSKGDDRKM